jgi:uncharacterized protein (UPF0332 family)
MSLADDLLATAKSLAATTPATEADYRRAISTAYYALFHRLVEDATASLLSDAEQRTAVGRRFTHTDMKKVCQLVTKSPIPAFAVPFFGVRAPVELEELATAFVTLQEQRHAADYDAGQTFTSADARDAVLESENALARWAGLKATAVAGPFLLLLLVGEPRPPR